MGYTVVLHIVFYFSTVGLCCVLLCSVMCCYVFISLQYSIMYHHSILHCIILMSYCIIRLYYVYFVSQFYVLFGVEHDDILYSTLLGYSYCPVCVALCFMVCYAVIVLFCEVNVVMECFFGSYVRLRLLLHVLLCYTSNAVTTSISSVELFSSSCQQYCQIVAVDNCRYSESCFFADVCYCTWFGGTAACCDAGTTKPVTLIGRGLV